MLRVLFLSVVALAVGSPARGQAIALAGGGNRASVTAHLSTTGVVAGQTGLMAVVLDIKPGFHAQSNAPLDENLIRTEVSVSPHPAVRVGAAVYPAGQIVEYPDLGRLSVYSGQTVIYVPFEVSSTASAGPLKLGGQVSYQICDDKSCYPPETTPFTIDTEILAAGTTPAANRPELFAGYNPAAAGAAPPRIGTGGSLQWSWLGAFGAALVAGLLFNVMPCVLPVLPLKAMSFYEVSQHQREKSILLGLVFSAGIVAFFAGVAVVILVFKSLTWGQQFSNPLFVWGIVIILVAMAAGMFGLFNVNLPTGVYRFTPRHDTYTGNFLFGIFTAILSTPCTAPLFPPLMIWAAAQPVVVGVPAVMMVGVGMALPYVVLSAFPGLARNFPRTGPWSELVKQMMGFLLLGAAVYFGAGQVIEGPSFWWAVVAVVAVACVYLVGRTIQFSKTGGALAVSATVAVALFGTVLYVTLSATGLLRNNSASAGVVASHAAWTPYSPEALAEARKQNRVALVKFTANWCANCQYIEATVFGDPATWSALQRENVVLLKADMTRSNEKAQELLVKLNPTGGIPLTAIYSPRWTQPLTLDSVYTTATLLQAIAEAKAGAAVAARP